MVWEYGSDWHWPDPDEASALEGQDAASQLPKNSQLFSSGRAALLGLLGFVGVKGRVFLPTYYCGDVADALQTHGLSCLFYKDNPRQEGTLCVGGLLPSDVLVTVSYFGARLHTLPSIPDGVVLIEDHTHDPVGTQAMNSAADYCFASLRKVLPLPDGGILWSPQNKSLPESIACTTVHHELAKNRIEAMRLKTAYLRNRSASKGRYRALFQATESQFGIEPVGGPYPYTEQLLVRYSLSKAAKIRRQNLDYLKEALGSCSLSSMVTSLPRDDSTLGLVLEFASKQARETVRLKLIEGSVFPSVLWPPDTNFDLEARDFSSCMLFIACDYRYQHRDIDRMLEILEQALQQLK